jgi:hypothetical protein
VECYGARPVEATSSSSSRSRSIRGHVASGPWPPTPPGAPSSSPAGLTGRGARASRPKHPADGASASAVAGATLRVGASAGLRDVAARASRPAPGTGGTRRRNSGTADQGRTLRAGARRGPRRRVTPTAAAGGPLGQRPLTAGAPRRRARALADVGRSVKTPELSGRLVGGEPRDTSPGAAHSAKGPRRARNPVGLEAQALYQDGQLVHAQPVLRSGRTGDALTGVPLSRTDGGTSRGSRRRHHRPRPAASRMAPRRHPRRATGPARRRGRSRCVRTPTCSEPTAPRSDVAQVDGQSVGASSSSGSSAARRRARRRHRPPTRRRAPSRRISRRAPGLGACRRSARAGVAGRWRARACGSVGAQASCR